ncbi:MAG TPA: polymerase, partial [Arsenicitalea sp.]|nr:polymerase [Arsenicitalea sp.]
MKPRARSSNRLSRQQLADTVPIPVKAGSGSRSLRLKRVREEPRRHLPWPVIALFIAWALPWRVLVGGLAISPYRIVLIIMILPCLGLWLSGRAGRIRVADIAVLCFCLWGALSLLVLNGGSAAIQSGGILFVETMGAYLLARCYIRNADDFRGLARLLFWIVALLLPFAIIEAISGRDVGLALFSSILPSHPVTTNIPRWGLRRVQTIFEHPILMGVCCSSILALTHLVLGEGKPLARRWTRSLIVVLTAALSLSSGPWSAIVVQSGLMGWNWSLGSIRARWKILIGLVVAMLVLIQLFAKRPLPNILFSSFAFDADSAFFRLLIWNYGTESVGNHPLFGVGLGEWDRPFWMGPSIDMFWLYNAITYGLPGGLLMLLAFLSIILPIGFRDLPDGKLYQYRAAFLIALTSLFLVGWM